MALQTGIRLGLWLDGGEKWDLGSGPRRPLRRQGLKGGSQLPPHFKCRWYIQIVTALDSCREAAGHEHFRLTLDDKPPNL